MEDNEIQTSKYSSGVNINLRIDQLWKDTHLHSRNSMYNAWNLDLDCIWSELSRDFKEKEDKENGIKSFDELKKEFDKFEGDILKHGQIDDKKPVGFRQSTPDQIKARSEHYKILRNKQLFLARLENKLGKGTTYDDDDDDDID